MPVTLLNVFIVPNEKEEEFLNNWRATAEHFSKTPGFVECHFHRNTGVGNGTFKFINIAKWDSAEAWRVAHDAYPPTEYKVDGVKGHPAIFEVVAEIYREGSEPRPFFDAAHA